MRILYTLVLSLAVILNSIELGLPFDCLPNGEPIPRYSTFTPSVVPDKHSPERISPLAEAHSSAASPLAEPSLRVRSISPSAKNLSAIILRLETEEVPFIRLVSKKNSCRIFKLRKYIFPPNAPIRVKTTNGALQPMPTEAQIVLTAPEGDVFALLHKPKNHAKFFRGMYTPVTYSGKRAKINIVSSLVKEMTTEEVAASPLGSRGSLAKNFRIVHV